MRSVYEPKEPLKSRHVVVTGAAGFIGSHLVDRLLKNGECVIGIDDFDPWYSPSQKRRNLNFAQSHDHFTLIEANLGNKIPLEIFRGARAVFHLAGRPGVQDSWGEGFVECVNRNTAVTQWVYEEALASSVEKVIYASSSSVYGSNHRIVPDRTTDPISPYGVAKLAGEHLAGVYRERGLSICCLRYFTVFGPRQRPDMSIHRMFEATRKEGSTFVRRGSGTQRREFTFVDDVVNATIAASELPSASNDTLDIGGGSSVSLNEVAECVQRLTDSKIRLRPTPHSAGDPRDTAADLDHTRSVLGWEPSTDFEQGLRAQWLWHFGSTGDVRRQTRTAEPTSAALQAHVSR